MMKARVRLRVSFNSVTTVGESISWLSTWDRETSTCSWLGSTLPDRDFQHSGLFTTLQPRSLSLLDIETRLVSLFVMILVQYSDKSLLIFLTWLAGVSSYCVKALVRLAWVSFQLPPIQDWAFIWRLRFHLFRIEHQSGDSASTHSGLSINLELSTLERESSSCCSQLGSILLDRDSSSAEILKLGVRFSLLLTTLLLSCVGVRVSFLLTTLLLQF